MKKLYFLLLFLPSIAFATTYPGNGGIGFGGPIGGSTLNITDNGTTVTFQLTTAGAFSGNDLVIYIDNEGGGGYANTSTFTDNADGGRTAISGYSNPGRTRINFPAGFTPQRAISMEPGVFAGVFDLGNPSNFTYVNSGGLTGAGAR